MTTSTNNTPNQYTAKIQYSRYIVIRDTISWAKRTHCDDLRHFLFVIERNLPGDWKALRFCAHLAAVKNDAELTKEFVAKLVSALEKDSDKTHILSAHEAINQLRGALSQKSTDLNDIAYLLSEEHFEGKRNFQTQLNEYFASARFPSHISAGQKFLAFFGNLGVGLEELGVITPRKPPFSSP
jgi:hypothetical protein